MWFTLLSNQFVCSLVPVNSKKEYNDFLFQCGLPSLEECKELAESAQSEGEIFQAVKYYLLSLEPEKALPIGITYVKG